MAPIGLKKRPMAKHAYVWIIPLDWMRNWIHISIHYKCQKTYLLNSMEKTVFQSLILLIAISRWNLMMILRSHFWWGHIKDCSNFSVQSKVSTRNIPTDDGCHVCRINRCCYFLWWHICYWLKSRRTPTMFERSTWLNSAVWILFTDW